MIIKIKFKIEIIFLTFTLFVFLGPKFHEPLIIFYFLTSSSIIKYIHIKVLSHVAMALLH